MTTNIHLSAYYCMNPAYIGNQSRIYYQSDTMPAPKLTLFLDVVSPFAYLAYYITRVHTSYLLHPPSSPSLLLYLDAGFRKKPLCMETPRNFLCNVLTYFFFSSLEKNAKIFKECEITYVPIFLGGVMKACNNKTPIDIKSALSFPLLLSSLSCFCFSASVSTLLSLLESFHSPSHSPVFLRLGLRSK